MYFEYGKWIWHDSLHDENEYGEFYDKISYQGKNTVIKLSVFGDYTLFINGKFVSSNQYGDYEHYKVYDEIDITPYLNYGENHIGILVWYFGKSGSRYKTPTSGLIYEILSDNEVIAFSSENTLSRMSKAYVSGHTKTITPQLGYSFIYNAPNEDDWLINPVNGFGKSVIINKECTFYKRPIEKLLLGETVFGDITKRDNGYIIDLGEEMVGIITFSLNSPSEQTINFAYGECLVDGHVKRIIGNRDFSFDYICKQGENTYTNYMLRLGVRYIEISSDYPLEAIKVGIIKQYYDVKVKEIELKNPLDKKIYDICVNTLKLCMMEHYVDCPWREECMYAFDSRNQMLSGYTVFIGGNYSYARANLLLMSKDNRNDGLLSLCFPSGKQITIPSFSLYYILAVKEYLLYSGDLSLIDEVIDVIKRIIKVFINNMKDGLICKFDGDYHWNFYDWSYMADTPMGEGKKEPDFLINAIFVMCLDSYNDICKKINIENEFKPIVDSIKTNLLKTFYNEENGLFFVNGKNEKPTELANSLAVLSGICNDDMLKIIGENLSQNKLVESSLSMKTFKYDALLKIDRERHKETILNEIRNTYKIMLDYGSTTVWETIEGEKAFDNAGSLCHGWSAIPVYYYNLFN